MLVRVQFLRITFGTIAARTYTTFDVESRPSPAGYIDGSRGFASMEIDLLLTLALHVPAEEAADKRSTPEGFLSLSSR